MRFRRINFSGVNEESKNLFGIKPRYYYQGFTKTELMEGLNLLCFRP